MSQYHDTHCILCGCTILMSMSEDDICNPCMETSAPVDEIISLRAQLKAAQEFYGLPAVGQVYSFLFEGEETTFEIISINSIHVNYRLAGSRHIHPMTHELWKSKPDGRKLVKHESASDLSERKG